MPQYASRGNLPHKRHTQFRDGAGALLFEEMFTTHGFAGAYSLLYHVVPPTEVLQIRPGGVVLQEEWIPDVQRPHLFDSADIAADGEVPDSRRAILFNDDLTLSVSAPSLASTAFYRNALCDEVSFIAAGTGEMASPFGVLRYGPGDMIVAPRGTIQAWRPAEGVAQRHLLLESATAISPPARYFNPAGQFNFRSPIAERDVRLPELAPPCADTGAFRLRVKHGLRLDEHVLARHPFDIVGWDGHLYPYAINIDDFEPITRRVHTMPDENQIFETCGAAICCLVPRPLDFHPNAVPAPPYHMNVDVDEVVFNVGDRFMGWERPALGVMTLHPRGLPHGSKPGLYEGSIGMKVFDGRAIMVDAARPLHLTMFAKSCDDATYPTAWLPAPVRRAS